MPLYVRFYSSCRASRHGGAGGPEQSADTVKLVPLWVSYGKRPRVLTVGDGVVDVLPPAVGLKCAPPPPLSGLHIKHYRIRNLCI